MRLTIDVHLNYRVTNPCWVLLQIEAPGDETQIVQSETLHIEGQESLNRSAALDRVGDRIWAEIPEQLSCDYQAEFVVIRPTYPLEPLKPTSFEKLPALVVPYLMPSRYCSVHEYDDFIAGEFGDLQGGALITAAAEWLSANFTYDNGATHGLTTAFDAFQMRRGVCRDYAHVLISIARANAIPARYVSVYSPDVAPMDFHAVVEVFLRGQWHMVDPTGMATPERTVVIGVGRDATDVAFLTSFGEMHLQAQRVRVTAAES